MRGKILLWSVISVNVYLSERDKESKAKSDHPARNIERSVLCVCVYACVCGCTGQQTKPKKHITKCITLLPRDLYLT